MGKWSGGAIIEISSVSQATPAKSSTHASQLFALFCPTISACFRIRSTIPMEQLLISTKIASVSLFTRNLERQNQSMLPQRVNNPNCGTTMPLAGVNNPTSKDDAVYNRLLFTSFHRRTTEFASERRAEFIDFTEID